jgi:5-methylcytosine-specific restriction endonuclease McrA
MNTLAQLTDDSLHSETKRLVGASNTLTAQLLAHLGEVEARGIHRERACSSLYTYCVYELRMSEDEAQRRCRAARLARQFPILLEMLAEASLHLTGILLLGPHLSDENCGELLARARFRTKREIERLVAEIAPGQDVPSRIVPLHRAGADDWMISPLDDLPRPRNTWAAYVQGLAGEVRELQAGLCAGQAPPRASDEEFAAATGGRESSDAPDARETGVCTPAFDERRNESRDESRPVSSPLPAGAAQPTAPVPPLAEPRYKVQFTADQAYVDLLQEARNLLQHERPARDIVAVQRRALELLVHKLRQRKYAASGRPGPKAPEPMNGTPRPQPKLAGAPVPPSATRAQHSAPPSATPLQHSAPRSGNHARQPAPKSQQSRYIAAEVRRSVWKRDEARCTYVDASGHRCREQAGLEFHHEHPHARGGPPSVDNLALRCRSHNELAAERDFGRDVIREKRARRRSVVEPNRAGAAP